jgi:hypothetical protein
MRRFCTSTGTFVAAASPDELADAPAPDAVLLAMLDVAEADEELVSKLVSFVTVAVKPVTLVQLEPTVLLTPVTKLTGAHYKKELISRVPASWYNRAMCTW